jgi:hypothetical protein
MPGKFTRRPFTGAWTTLELFVDPVDIQTLCTLFEAYENLVIVRTMKRGEGVVYVYHAVSQSAEVRAALVDFSKQIPLQIVAEHGGMHDLDRVLES